jgi:hypothetical protein
VNEKAGEQVTDKDKYWADQVQRLAELRDMEMPGTKRFTELEFARRHAERMMTKELNQ